MLESVCHLMNSSARGIWSVTWSRKKNTKTWRLWLPQSQITVACSGAESNSSDPVVHLQFVTVIKPLCYFHDLFCFFAACYKILLTKLSNLFFLNCEIQGSSRGRDVHNSLPTDLWQWRTKNNEHGTHKRPTLTTMTLVGFGCWSKSDRVYACWKNVVTPSSLKWISVFDVKNRRNSGTHVPPDDSQTSIICLFNWNFNAIKTYHA